MADNPDGNDATGEGIVVKQYDTPLRQVVESPQEFPNALKGETAAVVALGVLSRGPILAQWGDRQRLRDLWYFYLHNRNALVQGTFAGLAKRGASTPWEISGPPEWMPEADDLFRNAQYGRGWSDFCQRIYINTLWSDIGAWILLIGPTREPPIDPYTGKPQVMADEDYWSEGYGTAGPLYGPPDGLAALDPLRIYPTGDPIYPAIYVAKSGKRNLLHHSRVVQILDNPLSSERHPGWGLSALSRAIATVQTQILINQYITASLDDVPLPGFLVFSGITPAQFQSVLDRYGQRQRTDQHDPLGQMIRLYSMQPEIPVSVTPTTFSQPPAKFDYATYMEVDARILATAIGVDPQDIYPLSSGNLGSGTQTEILEAQARGKTEGFLRAEFERQLNRVLPVAYKFSFSYSDARQDMERAQIAQTHANTVQVIGQYLTVDEVREYMVTVDDTFKRILTDDAGQVRRITDEDPKPDEALVSDEAPLDEETIDEVEAETEQAQEPSAPPSISVIISKSFALKEWAQTRQEFVDGLARLILRHPTGVTGRSKYARALTRLLRDLGTRAYLDGLAEGGVPESEMTQQDKETIAAWLAQSSKFRSDLTSETYPRKYTPAQAQTRAELWANKTLREIYQKGRASALRDKMMMWQLGQTEQHCRTCLYLNGQVHRMSTWQRSGYLPGSDILECRGFLCDCRLVETNQSARGRLPQAKALRIVKRVRVLRGKYIHTVRGCKDKQTERQTEALRRLDARARELKLQYEIDLAKIDDERYRVAIDEES